MIDHLKSAHEIRNFFNNQKICIKYLKYRRTGSFLRCPKCESPKVNINQTQYKCQNKECRKGFSFTTGTIFEQTRIPLQIWFEAITMYIIDPKKAYKLKQEFNISHNSNLFLHHRIMEMFKMDLEAREPKKGTWEFDEVYVGRMESRMSKKRREAKEKIAGYSHRTPILAMYHREDKELFGVVIPVHAGKEFTQSILKKYIHQDSKIYCDKSTDFSGVLNYFTDGKQFNHFVDDYGGGKDHSNTIEGAFKDFKTMVRIHTHIEDRYLQRYWDEYCWRYNCSQQNLTIVQKFEKAFDNVFRRITQEDLIKEGNAVDYMMVKAHYSRKFHQEVVRPRIRKIKKILREIKKLDNRKKTKIVKIDVTE
jgi:hypothetical protein